MLLDFSVNFASLHSPLSFIHCKCVSTTYFIHRRYTSIVVRSWLTMEAGGSKRAARQFNTNKSSVNVYVLGGKYSIILMIILIEFLYNRTCFCVSVSVDPFISHRTGHPTTALPPTTNSHHHHLIEPIRPGPNTDSLNRAGRPPFIGLYVKTIFHFQTIGQLYSPKSNRFQSLFQFPLLGPRSFPHSE